MKLKRHHPAVRASWARSLAFPVDWRFDGFVGISTDNPDEARLWRQARGAQGFEVIEDKGPPQSPNPECRKRFRYRPAIRANWREQLPFRVTWRSGGLQGISTNNADEAEAWRQARRSEGWEVIECDARSRRHRRRPPFTSLVRSSPRLMGIVRAVKMGDLDLDRALVPNDEKKLLRRYLIKEAMPRLLATVRYVQGGSLVLERCPIPRYEKTAVRGILRKWGAWGY